MAEKALCWLGSSLDDLRAFPEKARREAGYQLGRVQQGVMPDDWKPMADVGPGVYDCLAILGRESTLTRIDRALARQAQIIS